MTLLDTVRMIGRLGNVVCGGDCVFSMAGLGVNGADVRDACAFASKAVRNDPFVHITGKSVDGQVFTVIAKINGNQIDVENVV